MGLSRSVQVMTVPFNIASWVTVALSVEVKSDEELELGTTEIRVAVNIPRCVSPLIVS